MWRGADASAGFSAGFVRVRPVEVIVRDEHGDERSLAVTDPTADALRGMGIAAVAVAGLAILLGLIVTILTRRGPAPVPAATTLGDDE
jgi:hypothetical protein